MFKTVTEMKQIANHNDFCKNQGFDQGHSVIGVGNTNVGQNEPAVPGERPKNQG